MFELNDTHRMIQDMFRQYMMNEIEPIIDDIEDGRIPLFDPLRKMVDTLGIRSQIDALDLSRPPRTLMPLSGKGMLPAARKVPLEPLQTLPE